MKNLLILFAIIALVSCKKDECPEPDNGEKRNIEFVFKCDAPYKVWLGFDQQLKEATVDSGTHKITIEYMERVPDLPTHYFSVKAQTTHDKPINIKWYYKSTGGETSLIGPGIKYLPVQALNLP